MSLITKYRPNNINDFVGNNDMVRSFVSVFDRSIEKVPHAFLITGPRGCGKTTIGRIIKNNLKCSDFDFIEKDCGDERGINDIRKIRKNMYLAPMDGKVKVYLLDEAHMIGRGGGSVKNEAQNALLKALEEPPEHVYFILATTNPEMLLKTVKSRCMEFTVDILDDSDMFSFLKKICKKEKRKISKDILNKIIIASGSKPREALSLLDKIIYIPKKDIPDIIKQHEDREKNTRDLCNALLKKSSWRIVSKILKAMKEEPETVRRIVRQWMGSVLLNSGNPQAYIVMDSFSGPFFDDSRNQLIQACYESIN